MANPSAGGWRPSSPRQAPPFFRLLYVASREGASSPPTCLGRRPQRSPRNSLMSAEPPGQVRGAWQRQADWTWGMIRRIHLGAQQPGNWAQLFQFGVVGATGYIVNLTVFTVLAVALHFHHNAGGIWAFFVCVFNKFRLDRNLAFREEGGRGDSGFQATRFLTVSVG